MTRRLDSLYVFLVENADGDEGVAAIPAGRRLEPMIAATEEKFEQLRQVAQSMVGATHARFRIVRFTSRVDVEEIG